MSLTFVDNHTKSKEGHLEIACNNWGFYFYKERKALLAIERFKRTHHTSIMMLLFEHLPHVSVISCPVFAWATKSFATILTVCNGMNALFIPFWLLATSGVQKYSTQWALWDLCCISGPTDRWDGSKKPLLLRLLEHLSTKKRKFWRLPNC